MRIALTAFTFLCDILAHAEHIAPWHPDGDGVRVGVSTNGGGVVVCRVSSSDVESMFSLMVLRLQFTSLWILRQVYAQILSSNRRIYESTMCH